MRHITATGDIIIIHAVSFITTALKDLKNALTGSAASPTLMQAMPMMIAKKMIPREDP